MQQAAAPQPWTQTTPSAEPRCERCGRTAHVIAGDGATICRVCLFAWGHYTRVILRGRVVREAGGIQLRHAAHDYPTMGCPLCGGGGLRPAASFDGWMRGRNA